MKKSRERLSGNDLLRWAAILQDFFSLQQKMFSIISKDDIGALFFEELLNFGTSSEFLQMTSNFICPSLSFEDENKNESGIVISKEIVNLELLPFQKTAEVIFEVSERFIIGATDLEDEYLKIALDILHLIEVEEEGEIMSLHKQKISLLQIMNFFRLKDIKSAPHQIVSESKSSPLNLIEYALKKESIRIPHFRKSTFSRDHFFGKSTFSSDSFFREVIFSGNCQFRKSGIYKKPTVSEISFFEKSTFSNN